MEDFLILFSFTIHAPGHVRVSSVEHSFHPKVSHPLRLRLSLRPRKSFAYAVRQPPSSSHAFCPLSPLSLCLLNSPSTEWDGECDKASRRPAISPPSQSLTLYRGANKGLYVLLSRTQAGPGRTVKQEHDEISRNHVQTFISPSVVTQYNYSDSFLPKKESHYTIIDAVRVTPRLQ